MNQFKTTCIGTGALLIAGFLAASSPVEAADVPDSGQVTRLLVETKAMAVQLSEDAAVMESFSRMNVSLETHAVAINQIREHVTALERQQAKLEEAKVGAAPWQAIAINRISPFLDELEGYTDAVIEHVNARPKVLTTAEYNDFLAANADYSSDLATMIGDFVRFGRTKERLERLTRKLEVPVD
jgi:hypothetical protein